jgi:hypothetical protein
MPVDGNASERLPVTLCVTCAKGSAGSSLSAVTLRLAILAPVTAFFFTRAGAGKFTEQAKDRTGATPAAWHLPL